MEKRNKSVIGNRRSGERPSSPSKKAASRPSGRPGSSRSSQSQSSRSNSSRSSRPPQRIDDRRRNSNDTLPKKRRKKRGFFKKALILLLVLLIGAGAYAATVIKFGNLNKDLTGKVSQYNISSNATNMALNHRIVNVAIFGVDGRDDVDGSRSDSMMIASADFEHNKLKITSLMRDTYVYINKDYGYDKLNAAYSFGGPNLALKTINQNFDTAITDYVTIDFTAMVAMVNAVGGVTIDIENEDELYWVNQYLMDVNDKVKTNSPFLEGTGAQVVDGSQALAYCRVRYVGNGDFDRTLRQRKVFEQVMAKAVDLNPLEQYSLLTKVMPYVETSLSKTEILKYAGNVMFMKDHAIHQEQIPAEGYVDTGMLGDVSYVFPVTLVDNIKEWYQFVYETDYTPSGTAQDISDEIEYEW